MEALGNLYDLNLHSMEDEKLIEVAQKYKELGKEKFIDNNLEDAFENFTNAIKCLITIDPKDAKEAVLATKKEMLTLLYNNTAGCHLLKENWGSAIDLCNSVLDVEPTNVKALYRRGTAFIEIQEYEKARKDLLTAQSQEPNNPAVQRKISILNARVKSYNEKTGKAMMK